jgi:hypothetical protein
VFGSESVLSWTPGAWGDPGPWLALVALGLFHGVNPAMGWLFAVALGLQRGSRRVVLGALLPLALGHEAAVAAVLLLGVLAGAAAPPDLLRPAAALGLVAFGAYKLLRPRSHPRWVGMRVGPWDLALWSFLMASAHGAGLMLLPVLFGLDAPGAPPLTAAHPHAGGQAHGHALETAPVAPALPAFSGVALARDGAAVVVHTLAMLLAMSVVAVLVYERLGVAVLRRAWINFDALWAVAVLVAGIFTLFT